MAVRIIAPRHGNIELGKQGENLAREIAFDVSEWKKEYGDGKINILARRFGETLWYPVHFAMEDDYAVWKILDTDLEVPGTGECELLYVQDDVVVKSCTYSTMVKKSMSGNLQEPLPPGYVWVSDVIRAAEAVKTAQVNAPKIGDNGNWHVWDIGKEEYVDTGVSAGGNGATFMPTISENGVISWENDKNHKNPTPVDLAAAVLGALPEEIKSIQIFGNDTHNAEFISLGEIIGAPIVGHIEGKVIKLTGDPPKGVYEFKLVKADGSTADICTYEVV